MKYDWVFAIFSRAQDEEKGSFLQDILDQIDEDDSLHRADKENSPNANTYSVEQTLVDLVAGNETDRVDRIIKKLSGDSDASLSEEFSDIDDPIHEESLLTDLFYTAKSVSPQSYGDYKLFPENKL